MTTAYFDNCVVSGMVRGDLVAAEMTAIRSLKKASDSGQLEIVASRESWREQERSAASPKSLADFRATRRASGKVKHEHVASLGSVPHEPSVPERIAFWQRLHERLARLANRIDAEAQAKILGAVHAKAPIVTPDEQRDLQLANAQADDHLWSSLRDLHEGTGYLRVRVAPVAL